VTNKYNEAILTYFFTM